MIMNNGSWRIAFWVMTAIATLGLGGVLAWGNLQDYRLECKIQNNSGKISVQYTEIIQRLTRIETMLRKEL